MDVKLVRARLALVVATVTLRGKKIQGLASTPASINPPSFFTVSAEVDRYPADQRGIGGLRAWKITGKLLVGMPDEQAAQEMLDELMSDGDADVAALLEANGTLGGACEELLVSGFTDYGPHEVGGQPYLGVNVGIRLWAF